jgi:hypothetical protein
MISSILAEIIKSHLPNDECWDDDADDLYDQRVVREVMLDMIYSLADRLRENDPKFDRERFLYECGA